MELLGVGGILFWLGLLMFFGGFRLVWVSLKRHGGLEREQTLHVAFDDDSPMRRPEHRRDRLLFRGGVFVAAFGVVNVFTAVTVGDPRERMVCGRLCQERGYWGGRFAPSTTEKIQGTDLPQRACWCVGPAGSVELPSRGAPLPSTKSLSPSTESPPTGTPPTPPPSAGRALP